MNSRRGTIIRLIVSLVLLLGAGWLFLNRMYVVDQIAVWRYTPTLEISQMASRSSMNDNGRFLFYASTPSVQDRNEFNQFCRKIVEKSAVLGCYTSGQIYIYNISDPRLDGIKDVTAAHEMLHAAYDRLSPNEKSEVDAMIETAAAQVDSESLKRKLELYDTTEPTQRLNELHSMLGTEIKSLPPDLETYYARYFTNRLTLVSLSERYEQVFGELEKQQKQLVSELNALVDDINESSASYTSQFASLQDAIESFNTRAENGSYTSESQFNSERNRLIAQQANLREFREDIAEKVALYDTKKAELDNLNVTAQGLQNSIDSTALPEVPTL
jgi:uncharacterized protein YoxC